MHSASFFYYARKMQYSACQCPSFYLFIVPMFCARYTTQNKVTRQSPNTKPKFPSKGTTFTSLFRQYLLRISPSPKRLQRHYSFEVRNIAKQSFGTDTVSLSVTPAAGMSNSKTDDNGELKGVAELLRKQNLSIFEKDMEGDAMKRLREVSQKVERVLVEQMRSTHKTDSDPQIAIRLLSLGENDPDATPCLVVFCAPKKCKRIRRLLNSGRVMKLCKPERGLPGLEVRVIGCSPQMWLLYQDAYFGFKPSKSVTATTTTNDQTTSSGAPISLTSVSEEPSRPWKRKDFGKWKATIDLPGLRREQSYLGPYSKQWEPLFSTDRRFRDGEAYIPQKRLMGADGDDFAIFFTDFEESVPSFEVEKVLEFCKWTSLRDLQSGVGTSGKRGAWLDDRSCPTREERQCARTYMNPLTARELYQLMNAPVRDDTCLKPNGDYKANPDGGSDSTTQMNRTWIAG